MDIFLGVLFLVICVLLIGVVLLQKGRGGGLAAAFGGAGSSAFGTRTGDVFTWVTIVLTALFLILAVVSNFAFRPPERQVATPGFDPPQGRIAGPIKVALVCETPDVRIRYTTDGSEPTEESALYEFGIRIEVSRTVTIRARAFHDKMKPSDVAVGEYTLAEPAEPAGETPPTEPAGETPPTEPVGEQPPTRPAP